MHVVLIQKRSVEALKGEVVLPITMSQAGKAEMVDKTRSAIVLCLEDKYLREEAKQTIATRCSQGWIRCI
jgi:hypothetical protein